MYWLLLLLQVDSVSLQRGAKSLEGPRLPQFVPFVSEDGACDVQPADAKENLFKLRATHRAFRLTVAGWQVHT